MMWKIMPYSQGSFVDPVLYNPGAECMAHCDQMANEESETCSNIGGLYLDDRCNHK